MSYDVAFFQEEGRVALAAAEVVVPWVLEQTGARTVADIGCGTGAWLSIAKEHGCQVFGVDGFAPDDALLIEEAEFVRGDLTRGIWAEADLAICLEVAEHLPPEAAEPLVSGLCGAAAVLFSAATPGQPGVGHINCRPHDYWHGLFAEHGKTPEHVGPLFDEPVADFYRRNMYLYR